MSKQRNITIATDYERQAREPGINYSGIFAGNTARNNNITSFHVYKQLKPLLKVLKAYDYLRLKLERNGGSLSDIQRINNLLNRNIILDKNTAIKLTEPDSAAVTIRNFCNSNIYFQVRKKAENGMPLYYICRTMIDYFDTYSLVVEDYYISESYPIEDSRFVSLMHLGSETTFLRLSQFRKPLQAKNKCLKDNETDQVLYSVGLNVLQGAWHDDQKLGLRVSEEFNLVYFRDAIELLYLCLSRELSALRNAISPDLVNFFSTIYPQNSIYQLLCSLPNISGKVLDDLPDCALTAYIDLSKAFRTFLTTEVPWGNSKVNFPLYKIVMGNFYRLSMVSAQMNLSEEMQAASEQLEEQSAGTINTILTALQAAS